MKKRTVLMLIISPPCLFSEMFKIAKGVWVRLNVSHRVNKEENFHDYTYFAILNRPFSHCYLPLSRGPLPGEISRYFTGMGQTVD